MPFNHLQHRPLPYGVVSALGLLVVGHNVSASIFQGNTKIVFPDGAHAELYSLGVQLLRCKLASRTRTLLLWRHFRGFAESDPATGRPFLHARDVLALAAEYAKEVADEVRTAARNGRPANAGSVVNPELAGVYFQRALERVSEAMRAILSSAAVTAVSHVRADRASMSSRGNPVHVTKRSHRRTKAAGWIPSPHRIERP